LVALRKHHERSDEHPGPEREDVEVEEVEEQGDRRADPEPGEPSRVDTGAEDHKGRRDEDEESTEARAVEQEQPSHGRQHPHQVWAADGRIAQLDGKGTAAKAAAETVHTAAKATPAPKARFDRVPVPPSAVRRRVRNQRNASAPITQR